ncbi:MAG: hypothetical protein QG671_652 [Actinomycetota bacterium]|nr:hypothetical protein [Actinomycetota bacterium]
MSRRGAVTSSFAVLGVLLASVVAAAPAQAVTAEQKLSVLSGWTQTDAGSASSWLSARNNQGAWSDYAFDWSTDYCSSSPDNPLGFDFTLSCARHDFGYRNYKAAKKFPDNKARLDSAFYSDLKRKCATYDSAVRPACDSLAWTYYQAVKILGTVAVSQADIDKAARLMPAGVTSAEAYASE